MSSSLLYKSKEQQYETIIILLLIEQNDCVSALKAKFILFRCKTQKIFQMYKVYSGILFNRNYYRKELLINSYKVNLILIQKSWQTLYSRNISRVFKYELALMMN